MTHSRLSHIVLVFLRVLCGYLSASICVHLWRKGFAVVVAFASAVAFTVPCSLLPRHRFHQKSKRTVETLVTCLTSFVMSQAHYNEIVRWNDERGLPACSRHVVGLFGYGKRAVAIDPEEAAIN